LNYFKLYNSLCKIVIIATCLVIFAGGFVRMTGSGMGCPDWPKCFGLWIPPINESDLPDNYIEIYGKNFSLLKNSDQIIDPFDLDFLKFNVFKTWTEYINRLLGATAGLFCLILSIISFLTYHRKLIFFSLFLLFLFAFQGWMGSVVVGSILEPSQITIHMLIAVCIMALLFFLYRMTLLSQVKIEINNK
jgi:cytochrome c oxidase assembly protein subunit 15